MNLTPEQREKLRAAAEAAMIMDGKSDDVIDIEYDAFSDECGPGVALALLAQVEVAQRLLRAAKVYTFNYLQDEHEEAELCTCGLKQHAELVELFAAIADAEKASS